RQTDRQTDR
ncbi:hypothetical protein V3C99_015579, partial [Haemonchus contortus]